MKGVIALIFLLHAVVAQAHHSHEHIGVVVDSTLSPPAGSGYLWMVLGPVAGIFLLALFRVVISHRRKR